MARWAAGVEYDGSAYHGWQRLPHNDSVQARVEHALSRVADHAVQVTASGRTDAGVHAAQQVVHFDSDAARSADAWRMGANSYLPRDVALRWAMPVAGDFHARYSAESRRYRYLLYVAPGRSALWHHRVLWTPHALDAGAMHRAAQALVGEHDFSAFRAAACQSPTPMRRIHALSVGAHDSFIHIDVHGNAFLHHMVRNIVGALLHVGQGIRPQNWIAELLAARDRTRAAPTAAAQGLYLVGPEYPRHYAIPDPPPLLL